MEGNSTLLGDNTLIALAIEKKNTFDEAKRELDQVKAELRTRASETGATFVSKDGVVVVTPKGAPTPRINIPAVIAHYGMDELGQNNLLYAMRARKQACRIISSGSVPIRFDYESEVDQESE